jgi:hypothetical protein
MNIVGWTFVVFLVLKLTGYIAWSWWWVTAPLWGAVAGFLVFVLLAAMGWVSFETLKEWAAKKK